METHQNGSRNKSDFTGREKTEESSSSDSSAGGKTEEFQKRRQELLKRKKSGEQRKVKQENEEGARSSLPRRTKNTEKRREEEEEEEVKRLEYELRKMSTENDALLSRLTSKEDENTELAERIGKMEDELRMNEKEIHELKDIIKEKEVSERETTSLREKLKATKEEKKRFQTRANHYQREAEEQKGKNEGLKKENEELLENNDKLEDFKKHCVAILTGENVSEATVRRFIKEAGGRLQLHVAVSLGVHRIAREMLAKEGAVRGQQNDRGWTPLQLAAARGDNALITELLYKQEAAEQIQPPLLHLAAANRHKRVVTFLKKMKMKIDKNFKYDGVTALDVALTLEDEKLAEEIDPFRVFKLFPKSSRNVSKEYIDDLLLFGGRKELEPTAKRARHDPERDRQEDILEARTENKEEEEREESVSESESSDEEQEARPHDEQQPSQQQHPQQQHRQEQHRQQQHRQQQHHQQQHRQHQPNKVRGLPNLGNTCYMNSVLQCLCHIEPLATHFSKLQGGGSQGKVMGAMVKVWESLQTGEALEKNVKKLKVLAAEKDETFVGYDQKEAHDFLSRVLDWLHADMVDAAPATENGTTVDGSQGSFVADLFRTVHQATITCHEDRNNPFCLSRNIEPALNLSLPVPRDGPDYLKGLLDKYYEAQWLSWDCPKCGKQHSCENKITISRQPSVLILHLSRVSELATSNQKMKVTYPLKGLVVDYTTNETSRSYNLTAVCCHDGGMAGGHYTAFCRVGEQWFFFNDHIVRPVEAKQVLHKPSAHILFFEAEETHF